MLRFLARTLGLLLLAAGFVGLVVDGTRSIANTVVSFTTVSEVAANLFPRAFPTLEAIVTRQVHPFLWDPVLTSLLPLPAGVVGFALGAVLLWLGQKPAEPIGYLTSP